MRKEYIEYMKDLPINILLANILEYPIHWQDSIKILFVLRGTIDVGVENEVYSLGEGELEIINTNEVNSISSKDENNLILILNIDPNFFARYYEDAKEVFFYTDSSLKSAQEEEKYYELRKLISILWYEAVSKIDDYEDKIEENLLKIMVHLLNNFHYLFYEGEGLEEDEEQLARYHRIVKYLSNNYMNKVSLKELADMEFLSSQYLSYKIKDTFGLGFNEYLNQIRVEESTKLLLDTDKNISEISEDVGFSHVRYYNKHFKLHYNMTPMQYRKKYKFSSEELEKIKKITYLDLNEARPYLNHYIEDYERYNYDNKIIRIDIDLDREMLEEFKKPEVINLGDIYLLLEEENRRILEEVQREIEFKYCIINNLFSEDMDVYRDKNHKFINWTRVENILDFLKELNFSLIINTQDIEQYIIDDFINHFSTIYEEDDVREWLTKKVKDLKVYLPKKTICKNHDTILMVPYLICNYTNLNNKIVLNLVDEISKETILNNDTFFGGEGIFTSNSLKKPSYYAYMLLSLLGDEIIYNDEGYIVTRSEEGYQMMLFNPAEIDEKAIYEDYEIKKIKERKLSINIFNMKNDFKITKYILNKEFGSVYDKWENLNSPERLDNDNWELLKEYIHPNISFYYGKKSTIYNTVITLKPYETVLLLFTNVLNSDN